MRPPRPARVASVRPGSAADKAGIAAGERIVRVNGRTPRDYVDYRYLTAEPRISLTIEGPGRTRRSVRIDKPVDEDLGIQFDRDVFDGIRVCRNRCSFCFVNQLPRGLRPALYLHDDDYRLSFLHGNFVTLTNLAEADRRRIVRQHLSPLYVSVHATEPDVRARLFGRPTRDVLEEMRRLLRQGIVLHTQIVVCPGVNDGAHLERTVQELASLHPGVGSIGVVPVGLTGHRRGLPRLRAMSAGQAESIALSVARWQREFRKRHGTRLVFAADELLLLAGRPIPGRAHYEDLAQLGNGIGGVRLFLDEMRRMRPLKLSRPLRVTLVTGEAAAAPVKELAARLAAGGSARTTVCTVPNRLLGRRVTTAGLLAGKDIRAALRRCEIGNMVLVPAASLREGEGFLDGMTLEELSQHVGVPVRAAGGPREAAAALRAFDRGRSAG